MNLRAFIPFPLCPGCCENEEPLPEAPLSPLVVVLLVVVVVVVVVEEEEELESNCRN